MAPEGFEDNYYTIKKGDTLYGIANSYGVSVDELKAANNKSNNNLIIGETLIIPIKDIDDNDISENVYVVKSGDTLYSIANKYGMTVDELKKLNNLSSNYLSIGQKLIVDEGNAATLNTYIVQSGDTLYSIAKKFNLSVDDLKNANNKTNNLLGIGETLVIPNNESMINDTTGVYIVQSGDTLYSIANKYGMTVDELKNLNNLSSNLLSIGQKLNINNNNNLYIVKKGDTLWSIANEFEITVAKLKELNSLTNNNLSIGQTLKIS